MAILGWTGSRQFERAIRDYAKKVNRCLYYIVVKPIVMFTFSILSLGERHVRQ